MAEPTTQAELDAIQDGLQHQQWQAATAGDAAYGKYLYSQAPVATRTFSDPKNSNVRYKEFSSSHNDDAKHEVIVKQVKVGNKWEDKAVSYIGDNGKLHPSQTYEAGDFHNSPAEKQTALNSAWEGLKQQQWQSANDADAAYGKFLWSEKNKTPVATRTFSDPKDPNVRYKEISGTHNGETGQEVIIKQEKVGDKWVDKSANYIEYHDGHLQLVERYVKVGDKWVDPNGASGANAVPFLNGGTDSATAKGQTAAVGNHTAPQPSKDQIKALQSSFGQNANGEMDAHTQSSVQEAILKAQKSDTYREYAKEHGLKIDGVYGKGTQAAFDAMVKSGEMTQAQADAFRAIGGHQLAAVYKPDQGAVQQARAESANPDTQVAADNLPKSAHRGNHRKAMPSSAATDSGEGQHDVAAAPQHVTMPKSASGSPPAQQIAANTGHKLRGPAAAPGTP